MTNTGTHQHHEHLQALRTSLRLSPLTPAERDRLERVSQGSYPKKPRLHLARSKACAPTDASAVYSLLGVGVFDDPERITDRELMALRMLASGATVGEIGLAVGYTTTESARTHVNRLFARLRAKVGARNNAHLIRIAYRLRLLNPRIGDPPLPPWSP